MPSIITVAQAFPVIDCHVHLWDTGRPQMTWPRKEHTSLYKPFLPETHEPICRANHVTGVVVVLSGQALEDNQWNLDVTAHNKSLYRGVVGNLSTVIGTDAFKPLFLSLCKDDRYVGYRLSGRNQTALSEAFFRDLRLTAKMGRAVDILVGSYSLEDVVRMAEAVPELRIMVNHLGGVQLSDKPLSPEWIQRFRRVAQKPNVYCKLSALYGRYKEQPAPMELAPYKPVIDLALSAFGPDRLVYGSDWPVTTRTGDYRSVITLTKSYFADQDSALARKIFHDNAVSFYRLPPTAAAPFRYNDPGPKRYALQARASELDSKTKEHPEVGFVFESKGKPADLQHAVVDTRVAPRGKLVIWLMAHSSELSDRLASYGLHAIDVHYARGWFSKLHALNDADTEHIGNIRLEAATGKDFSRYIDIPHPDGMMERAVQFVNHLARKHPEGKWEYFLTKDRKDLRWEHVIVSGSSHGSTTAARFAKHQRVSRVVMFSGPRDQTQSWQSGPSATPANRFFGFTHVLDTGWPNHYHRSWKMLGLEQFGPVVNVDSARPPYRNSRQLISKADVDNNARRAHGASKPGSSSPKNAAGKYLYEDVWEYLFTHPVQ